MRFGWGETLAAFVQGCKRTREEKDMVPSHGSQLWHPARNSIKRHSRTFCGSQQMMTWEIGVGLGSRPVRLDLTHQGRHVIRADMDHIGLKAQVTIAMLQLTENPSVLLWTKDLAWGPHTYYVVT